ncbi:MarR family transcriptional regulator [Bacillus sp. REN3]|uniref:MarR family winged helix-turn-helix transcriptional regulator n=1 Tax=Bacillus sp. REN3 TaxID=2802440 RepID=UPI001AED2348|nr:MarR family transcriptional regulator [Bacillus sp. REN3]
MEERHELFHGIRRLSRILAKRLNEALEPYGIYSSQWSVLFVLKEKGSMTQKELASYLEIEAPPLTRTLQKLHALGYIEQRAGADKRTKHIVLTERALESYPELEKAVLAANEQIVSGLPETSQKELKNILSEWLEKL